MIKLGFIVRKDYFPSKLTKLFTGCYCYHVGFHDIETDTFYDMNFTKRARKNITQRYKPEHIIHVDCPVEITVEDLQNDIIYNNTLYGLFDYLLFSVRWLYHLFGQSTPNAGGLICSEWCNDLLVEHGWTESPFSPDEEVPSPCDLLSALVPEYKD